MTTYPSGYVPFTYLLRHRPTGLMYYGSKFAQVSHVAHPDMLWTSYFTSSNEVGNLIQAYGAESFDYEIRKTFKTGEEALAWETRLLRRIDAKRNPRFLNKHNNDKKIHRIGPHGPRGKLKRARLSRGPAKEETKIRMRESLASPDHKSKRMKKYRCVSPEGVVYEGIGLSRLCREHGLTEPLMSVVCSGGRCKSHKGWTGSYIDHSLSSSVGRGATDP